MPDIIDIRSIADLMNRWEERLLAIGRHDNVRIQSVWLKLHGDGSGAVMGDYRKCMDGESDEEGSIRAVFFESSTLLEFESFDELHVGLTKAASAQHGQGESHGNEA